MKAWLDFLSSQTVQPLQEQNAICALRETGLLYVGGDDATDFLQNQLSNDIQLISPTLSQLSSFSNAKGRMFGIFRVIQIEGGYLLLLPHSILAEVQEQLHRYILRSKVILADITDSFCLFSITSGLDDTIQHDALPDQVNQVYQSDSLISVCLPAASGRRLNAAIAVGDVEQAVVLVTRLGKVVERDLFDRMVKYRHPNSKQLSIGGADYLLGVVVVGPNLTTFCQQYGPIVPRVVDRPAGLGSRIGLGLHVFPGVGVGVVYPGLVKVEFLSYDRVTRVTSEEASTEEHGSV